MAVAQNPQLESLKIGYNALGDHGAKILADGLAKHEFLKSIDLGFNDIGDQGCEAIAKALPDTITTLYLAGNRINEDGATHLAKRIRKGSQLKRLYLTGNKIGPEGVSALVQAVVDTEVPAEGSDGLGTAVEELYLGGTAMGDLGCRSIATLLSKSTRIRILSLPNCGIDDESMAMFAYGLRSNKDSLPLSKLELSFNRITCRGIEKLVNAIWGSPYLRELSLDNNLIDNIGAQHIGTVLSSLSSLEILNVSFNRIKSQGIAYLMKAVSGSACLRHVSISGSVIDNEAASCIAGKLATGQSLSSFEMVHCNIESEAVRKIAVAIASNDESKLKSFSGFKLGPILAPVGFPAALEFWTNEQILHFFDLMWGRFGGDDNISNDDDGVIDPLNFLDDSVDRKSRTRQFSVVIDTAKKAFNALIEEGSDVFFKNGNKSPLGTDLFSPVSRDAIVESSDGTSFHAEDPSHEYTSFDSRTLDTSVHKSFVAPPEPLSSERDSPDPLRKKKIVEWLCEHVKNLKKLEQLPFSSAELWKLHQHYFTPVVNETGGTVGDSSQNSSLVFMNQGITSVPEVSRGSSTGLAMDSWNADAGHSALVAASEPNMNGGEEQSFPLLKRKVSYKFLGDAMAQVQQKATRPRSTAGYGVAVSTIISSGPNGHTLPPKTKRTRRNRSRISFLPRIKGRLDSYLDVCHEKALITMRQLFYVEQAFLTGLVVPLNPVLTPRTHLSGDIAADVEMIIVDML